MTEREKVIDDLLDFVADLSPFAGNHEDWKKVQRAIKYLIEQEPVKPIVEQYALPLTNTSVRFIKKHYCGICKEEITGNNAFCHKCGRKVKWDEDAATGADAGGG